MIKSYLKALYWRLKVIRLLGKAARVHLRFFKSVNGTPQKNPLYEELKDKAIASLDSGATLPDIDIEAFRGVESERPFINLLDDHWGQVERYVSDLLGSPNLSDTLSLYFRGRPYLWNIGLNYSPPSKGAINGSQLWHFDYGDSNILHYVVYLNDVTTRNGPFTYLSKQVSAQIPRSIMRIERLTDHDVESVLNLNLDSVRNIATGNKGDNILVDPSQLLHQGARCIEPRLALFVTFTHTDPMVKIRNAPLTIDRRESLYKSYASLDSGSVLNRKFFI